MTSFMSASARPVSIPLGMRTNRWARFSNKLLPTLAITRTCELNFGKCVCNYFASATSNLCSSNLCCNNLITPMWCCFDGNEWLCNIRCVVVNYYDLGLLQVGLKSFMISTNYRDYMLLVDRFYTRTLIIWSVLWQLASEQVQHYKCSVVYLKTKEFSNKISVNQHLKFVVESSLPT